MEEMTKTTGFLKCIWACFYNFKSPISHWHMCIGYYRNLNEKRATCTLTALSPLRCLESKPISKEKLLLSLVTWTLTHLIDSIKKVKFQSKDLSKGIRIIHLEEGSCVEVIRVCRNWFFLCYYRKHVKHHNLYCEHRYYPTHPQCFPLM